MKNWNEFLASFGLWSLVEDISDDGDGEGDDLQLTEDGEIFVSEITQELEKAREEVLREVMCIGREKIGTYTYSEGYPKLVVEKILSKLKDKQQ